MRGRFNPIARQAYRTARRYAPYAKAANQAFHGIQALQNRAKQKQKVRGKGPGGHTATNTVRTAQRSVVQSRGGGITKSAALLNYKIMDGLKIVRKTSNLDKYRVISSGTVLSNYGEQGWNDASPSLTSSNLGQILNGSIATTTPALATLAPTPTDTQRGLWIEYYNCKTTLTNQGPSTIKMTIYNLLAKTTDEVSQINPQLTWGDGMLLVSGLNPAPTATNPIANPITPGTKPHDSPLFMQNFKILKTTEVEMHSGANHEHNFRFNYRGRIPLSKVDRLNATGEHGMKGITTWLLIVIKGMPVDNSAAQAAGVVTIDATKLIYTQEQEWASRLSGLKGKKLTHLNVLTKTPTGAFNQNPDSSGVHDTVANVVNPLTAWG
ncbi:MAG: putative capsid protein [Cressdnaviricota sp.]|nr:MAG: putative capsid protein [Cressdnaviricota sp.]